MSTQRHGAAPGLPSPLRPGKQEAQKQGGVHTFPQRFRFYDFAYASGSHSVLRRESELVPRPALEVFQAVGALAGADGEAPPLLAVVLRVLQDVAFRRQDTGERALLAARQGPLTPAVCSDGSAPGWPVSGGDARTCNRGWEKRGVMWCLAT